MKRNALLPSLALLAALVASGCGGTELVEPVQDQELQPNLSVSDAACWGQASAVFAQMGEMGAHASQQSAPRLGLANLARALYEAGAISEPTIQALGVFVAAELGLSIEACQ